MKKVLVLILSSNTYPANINSYFQKKTWLKNFDSYYFFYKFDSQTRINNNTLYLEGKEEYKNIGLKTIKAFEYCIENFEFDYILRTNGSSYIDKISLDKYLENKPKNKFYSGYVGRSSAFPDIDLVSGASILLSRDLIKNIVNAYDKLDFNLPDDIMLSYYFNDIGVPFIHVDRNEIGNYPNFEKFNFDLFHTRCRLDVHSLPRFFEGMFFYRIKKNYILFRKNKKPNLIIEKFFLISFYVLKKIIKKLKKYLNN